jgi:ATP-dependent Clp protease ATP-binding subunit ClpB
MALQNIIFEFDDKAINWLGNKGYDPIYGARPLKRVIQREVQNIMAKKLLAGEFSSGDTIILSEKNEHLVIDKATLN